MSFNIPWSFQTRLRLIETLMDHTLGLLDWLRSHVNLWFRQVLITRPWRRLKRRNLTISKIKLYTRLRWIVRTAHSRWLLFRHMILKEQPHMNKCLLCTRLWFLSSYSAQKRQTDSFNSHSVSTRTLSMAWSVSSAFSQKQRWMSFMPELFPEERYSLTMWSLNTLTNLFKVSISMVPSSLIIFLNHMATNYHLTLLRNLQFNAQTDWLYWLVNNRTK